MNEAVFAIAKNSADQALLDMADQFSGSLSCKNDAAVVLRKKGMVETAINDDSPARVKFEDPDDFVFADGFE